MSSDTSSTKPSQPQTVRFASVNQEIEPSHSIQSLTTLPSNISISNPEFSPEAQEEIRKLSRSLQSSPLQQRRMNHFAFEPVSLPTSRVSKPLYELAFETFSRIKRCVSLPGAVSIERTCRCQICSHIIQNTRGCVCVRISPKFCLHCMYFINTNYPARMRHDAIIVVDLYQSGCVI